MIYTDTEIEEELASFEFETEVYYVGILPSFIWDRKEGVVVPYHSVPSHDKELIVIDTELIQLEVDLKTFLAAKEITEENILIFCINQSYFPPSARENKKEKWVRIKIM